MARVHYRRRILIFLGSLLALLILLLAIAPLWVPWVLRPVLKKFDVTFRGVARTGYSQMTLEDVRYARSNVTFVAEKVETAQPTVWLWRRYVSKQRDAVLRVTEWQLNIEKRERSGETSPAKTMGKVERALEEIDTWVAFAELSGGEVHVKGATYSVPSVTWDHGKISGNFTPPKGGQKLSIVALTRESPKRVTVSAEPANVDLEVRFTDNAAYDRLKLEGTLAWLTNRVQIIAEFGDSWMPQNATANAQSFSVPAALVKLEGYNDLVGSFSGVWSSNRFSVDLSAEAEPLTGTELSPLRGVVRASGTTNVIRLETADITTTWLTANLSKGVEFNFAGELLSERAALEVGIDLGKQAILDATGILKGQAFLRRTGKRFPEVEFALASSGFEGYGVRLSEVKLSGMLDWPWLEIRPADFRFEDGAVGEAHGRLNLITHMIDNGRLKLNGQIGHEFLPHDMSYTNLVLAATVNGPIKTPVHSGHAEIHGLHIPKYRPLRVVADWDASRLTFDKVQMRLSANNAAVQLLAAANITTTNAAVELNGLTYSRTNQTEFALQRPAKVDLQWETKPKPKNNRKTRITVEPLLLRGRERELLIEGTLEWPRSATFKATGTNLSSLLLENLLAEPVPEVRIADLQAAGGWTNGPLDFVLRCAGSFEPVGTNSISFKAVASGNTDGISFENLNVIGASGPVLTGRGFLPIQLNPGSSTKRIHIREDQRIDFRADSAPNELFWDQVASWTRIKLTAPEVHLVLHGTMKEPRGSIVATTPEFQWLGTNSVAKLPTFRDIRADVALTGKALRLTKLQMLIEGQPFSATAVLPLDNTANHWKKLVDLRKASGRVLAKDVEFAAFVKLLPDFFSPQGTLEADVSFGPGPEFDGFVHLSGISTRPLPSSAPLSDLDVRLGFSGRKVLFQDVRGLLGGQPLSISGSVDFAQTKKNIPLFDVRISGDNMPLARTPDVVVRGNANLAISNLTNDVPVVSGEVRLRDSFYLGDIKQLIPGRVASVKRRPPYFTVTNQPFDEWVLNVRVTGENFLKVRSPLFRGAVSSNIRLVGNLREPLALGDVQIESGAIQFPFAAFKVTQGYVTLTSENPYRPDIFVNGASRAFGYDLAMSLTGPVDKPVIEFSSTPTLTSEQIILMVTAGEVPQRGFEYSTQQRAQKLAMFLGKSLLSKFSDEPAGAERLSITSGEEISERGRETYALEYKINDDWAIVGEYDRFGALNVGMKWRVYSR